MSNTLALIEEVKSDLSKYADANLLDENSMYRDLVKGLKSFGNDVMEIHETIVEVEDGEANLPEGFGSLHFAYLCEPMNYKKSNVEIYDLQEATAYVQRTERSRDWHECDTDCCNEHTDKVITEKLYFKREKVAEFYYQKPQLLKLGKSFNRSACAKECRNKMVKDNPNEIVIIKTTLQANFSEGKIYMRYYGLPVSENGMIDFPETHQGHLEEYLEYRIKRKAAERLIGNNDAVALSNMLGYYKNEERIAKRNASNELKMGRLKPRAMRRWSRLNKLESAQFESALIRH